MRTKDIAMTVSITVKLTESEARLVADSSMERFFKNAAVCGAVLERSAKAMINRENGSQLRQDSEEYSPLVSEIWRSLQHAILTELDR